MRKGFALLILSILLAGCSSNRLNLRADDHLRDISRVNRAILPTADDADSILKQYTVDFLIPNPLIQSNGASVGRSMGELDESVISCHAVLLDDFSTEADILSKCRADSLSGSAADQCRSSYVSDNVRDNTFRVVISMESNFSPKSMEPEYWAMYLETPDGVMLEPVDRRVSAVVTGVDSVRVGPERARRVQPRSAMKRDITLYFRKTTFFGENLLGGNISYLVLVMSREQRTVARIAWKLNSEPIKD
jgi:hypothetical protein